MTKNPILNALSAACYVALVSLIPYFGSQIAEPKDSALGPMAFLSVFTLSAAVMATIFFYQPIVLLTKGDTSSAFNLLIRTIGSFALITIAVLGTLLALQF